MRTKTLWALALCLGVTVLCSGRALAQDKPATKPADKPTAAKPTEKPAVDAKSDAKGPEGMDPKMMEKMMQMATPGPSHAYLKPFEGKWNYVTKWRMAPEAPWGGDKGVAEYKLIMGGRFLVHDAKSTESSQGGMPPFEGHGITGYDNVNKQFFNMWLDNMGTGYMLSTGKADDSGKTITMAGEYDDPMTGKKQKARSVLKNMGDKLVFEMYSPGPDGKEFMGLEVSYTKK